jgi:hypothetical protein
MNRRILVLAAVFASACAIEPCAAQSAVGPTMTDQNARSANDNLNLNTPLDKIRKEEFRQKRNLLGLKPEQLQAKDKADVIVVVNSAQFPCDVTNAQLLLEGSEKADGKTVKTKIYEAACGNGLGYFIIEREQQSRPSGFTCFAADATHDADVEAHREPGPVCTLPENLDLKTMATKVLLGKGKNCLVHDTRWIGQSSKSNSDYTEIACSDGNGFILASPLPGSTLQPQIVKCHDSAMQGLPCKLSDNGQIITLQTFKDALAQHQVVCDASDVRVIGKETARQRHVVEFACKQHPEGLIAYIPLDGNTAPFESLDCAAAAKRGLACKLTPAK